jgi:hypothetical protein
VSYHYHDDPVEESAVRRILPKFIAASVLMLFTFFYYQTTLASNITLNANRSIEFGQSVSAAVACSGSTELITTPKTSFVNATNGTGTHYLSTISVANIPSSCNGVDFTISVYDSRTAAALPMFNSTASVLRVWNDAGTFKLGRGSTSGAAIQTGNGAFTVSFTSPVARATEVSKLTLQSSGHIDLSCAVDGEGCSIGDTGPGGGTIFYQSVAGFNCGPNHTSTGSPTGGLCNFLEAAPANWSGGPDSGRAFVPPSFTNEIPNLPRTPMINSTSELGLGYKYSDIIVAVSADKTYAAGRARTYNGGGRSDWYLPVTTELNQLCKYVAGQPWVSDITICTGSSNPLLGMSTDDGYWTSSAASSDAKAAIMQRMLSGFQEPKYYVHIGAKIRPIRAF